MLVNISSDRRLRFITKPVYTQLLPMQITAIVIANHIPHSAHLPVHISLDKKSIGNKVLLPLLYLESILKQAYPDKLGSAELRSTNLKPLTQKEKLTSYVTISIRILLSEIQLQQTHAPPRRWSSAPIQLFGSQAK